MTEISVKAIDSKIKDVEAAIQRQAELLKGLQALREAASGGLDDFQAKVQKLNSLTAEVQKLSSEKERITKKIAVLRAAIADVRKEISEDNVAKALRALKLTV
ncbi:MAG: hypothetical protein QW587_04915 [Candidatus Bathyarchaeia archaeon]